MSNRRVRAEHLASLEKLKRRNRWLAVGGIGAAALGLLAATQISDAKEELPAEVVAAKDEFLEKYDCKAKEDIKVSLGNIDDFRGDVDGFGLAFTKDNSISIADDLFEQDLRPTMLHEMVHACADNGVMPFTPTPVAELTATGAQGFKIWFSDSTQEQPNTMVGIEEGVAEWVASGFPGYVASDNPGYRAAGTLMQNLASQSGVTRREVLNYHQTGDFVGFIAATSCVDSEDVTTDRIADYILGFNDAHGYGETVPVGLLSDC